MSSAEVLAEFTRNSGTGQVRTHWYDTQAMADEIVRLRAELLAWRTTREEAPFGRSPWVTLTGTAAPVIIQHGRAALDELTQQAQAQGEYDPPIGPV